MQKPSLKPHDGPDHQLGGPRKRKVQWADEEEDGEKPITASAPALDDPDHRDDGKGASSIVDEHGMLIAACSELRDSTTQSEAEDANAERSEQAHKHYLAAEIYNPIEYGDFRSYMKHKRAKLKVQEASLLQEEQALLRVQEHRDTDNSRRDGLAAELEAMGGKRSDALKGCCIYINGQTHPPYSELRRLLVLHGGDLMAYLDQKTPVTHIVASNLTPKKRIEFKDYKVVLPGWILESIELGRKADWRKWRCDALTGSNGHTSNSMVAKHLPASDSVSRTGGLGDWRNLDRNAKLPRQLPRIGDDDETPWGRPTNQTNLLDRFTKTEKPPADVAKADLFTARDELPKVHASDSKAASPPQQVKPKGVRFGKEQFIPISDVPAPSDVVLKPPDLPADLAPERSAGRAEEAQTTERAANPVIVVHNQAKQAPVDVTPTKPVDKIDYSVGTDPGSKKAAVAVSKSLYASQPSNTHAARLLASPSWRERNTATSEGFLAGYFAKSRLHHLSTWKTSLQDMVSSALREAGRPLGSSDLPKHVRRVIMHIDFDSFFVAVGLKKRPDLQGKPVVVCHGTGFGLPAAKHGYENHPADNQSSSTSEIASCSYKAREFGIRNGMSLGQAKRLCPHVETIPYDFEAYNSISLTFYTFLLEHSDALQAVSVDEALVDVSLLLQSMRDGIAAPGSLYDRYRDHLGSQGEVWTAEQQLAEAFRDEIREKCGCEASIGIGSNILLARLATRKAKPGGSFHLTDEAKQPFLDALNVDDLHGIGWSLRERILELFGTVNIGDILSKTTERKLVAEFGPKKGKMIWDKMHGIDADRLEGNKLRQSVGSHVNYGIRFLTEQEAENFVTGMCQEVAQRARAVKLRGRQVSVQVMIRAKDAPMEAPKFLGHGVCDTHHRSVQVSGPGGVAIDDEGRIKAAAWPLIRDLKADPKELRGIAISLNKLEPTEGNVLSPAKSKGGQSVLRFNSTTSSSRLAPDNSDKIISGSVSIPRRRSSTDYDEADASDSEQPGEPGVSLPASFEKGPGAATPRRPGHLDPIEPAASLSFAKKTSPIKLPPSTQLMLPSKSQIDSDVFDALPNHYRRQIEAKFGTVFDEKSGERGQSPVHEQDRTPRATPSKPGGLSASQSRARVLPRSTPTTPQKAKAAPSPTMAEALMLPSASQIDPTVLAELPDSVRKEIERQVGFIPDETSSEPSSLENTPTSALRRRNVNTSTLAAFLRQDDKQSSRRSGLFRSISESPTKKRVVSRLLQAAGPYPSVDQPAIDRDAILAVDPSKISTEALEVLGIDAEVFRALPVELQRETFRYHSEQKKSEKARFKAGKTNTFEELSLAEQRRRATLRAAQSENAAQKQVVDRVRAHGGIAAGVTSKAKQSGVLGGPVGYFEEKEAGRSAPLYLVARPRWRKPRAGSQIFRTEDFTAEHNASSAGTPSIRGLSKYEDVEKLIGQWVTAFAKKGPRAGDVDRIGTYLADIVRSAAEGKVEDTQKAVSLIKLIETRLEAQREEVSAFAELQWEEALDKIRNTVQCQARLGFKGAELAS